MFGVGIFPPLQLRSPYPRSSARMRRMLGGGGVSAAKVGAKGRQRRRLTTQRESRDLKGKGRFMSCSVLRSCLFRISGNRPGCHGMCFPHDCDRNARNLLFHLRQEYTGEPVWQWEKGVAHIVERLLCQGRLCHKVLGDLPEWRTARRHRLSQGRNRHRPEAGRLRVMRNAW